MLCFILIFVPKRQGHPIALVENKPLLSLQYFPKGVNKREGDPSFCDFSVLIGKSLKRELFVAYLGRSYT